MGETGGCMMYDKDDREIEPVESRNMSEQLSGGYIAEYLTPLLYELSIANAPLPPEDCRDLADKIGARIGGVRHRVETALSRLETIDTTKLAAKGLYDEARAVGEARVFIDQLIGLDRNGGKPRTGLFNDLCHQIIHSEESGKVE